MSGALGRYARRLRAHASEDRGQSAIAFLLFIPVLLMFLTLPLDAGIWYLDHRTAQNQADVSSHAAAMELVLNPTAVGTVPTAAIAAGEEYLARNGADAVSSCADPDDGDLYQGFAFWATTGGTYDRVQVCVSRHSPSVFSTLAGMIGIEISAKATASFAEEPLTYALMAMNPDGCTGSGDGLRSMNFAGRATVNLLDDGGTYTRSDCDGAMYIDGGNASVNAGGEHDVVGRCAPATRCASSQVNPDPTNNYGEILDDPFESYAQPIPGACRTDFASFQFTSGVTSLAPGTYCTPLVLSSTAEVRLQSGTHIFRAGVMVAGNSPRLISDGPVLIYMTCATGNSCNGNVPPRAPGCSSDATFCLQGGSGSTISVSGPATQPKAVIWVDRTAGAYNSAMVRIAGQGAITIEGNLYAISGTAELQGQGAGQNVDITGTIVADKIQVTGQATYNVTWDADLAPRRSRLALIE